MFLKDVMLPCWETISVETEERVSAAHLAKGSGRLRAESWEPNPGESSSAVLTFEKDLEPGTGFLQNISKCWKRNSFDEQQTVNRSLARKKCSVCLKSSCWHMEHGVTGEREGLKERGWGLQYLYLVIRNNKLWLLCQCPLLWGVESRHTFNWFHLMPSYTEELFWCSSSKKQNGEDN